MVCCIFCYIAFYLRVRMTARYPIGWGFPSVRLRILYKAPLTSCGARSLKVTRFLGRN